MIESLFVVTVLLIFIVIIIRLVRELKKEVIPSWPESRVAFSKSINTFALRIYQLGIFSVLCFMALLVTEVIPNNPNPAFIVFVCLPYVTNRFLSHHYAGWLKSVLDRRKKDVVLDAIPEPTSD